MKTEFDLPAYRKYLDFKIRDAEVELIEAKENRSTAWIAEARYYLKGLKTASRALDKFTKTINHDTKHH